jgi:hypothetical protein
LILLDEETLIRNIDFCARNLQLVHLWAATLLLNSCLINYNMRRM